MSFFFFFFFSFFFFSFSFFSGAASSSDESCQIYDSVTSGLIRKGSDVRGDKDRHDERGPPEEDSHPRSLDVKGR